MNYIFTIISTLISSLFGYLRYKYTYWESRGIKQLKMNFLFGNLFKLKTLHFSNLFEEVYTTFKGQEKVAGTYIYTKPIAVVLDLEIVKNILIKDFNKFVNRNPQFDITSEPLLENLFNAHGESWRQLRTKLSPTFTSGKMKYMFPTILSVAKEFESAFEQELQTSSDNNIELHEINARFTTDVIGTCAFGIECNSLKDPNVEFRQIGRRVFHNTQYPVPITIFLQTYGTFLLRFGIKITPKWLEEFIMRVVRDTMRTREELNIQRNDFMSLLLELKNSNNLENGITFEQIAAQVFIFFAAGFETSSSNMSYALYELAKNPVVQNKLRAEILEVLARHNGELTYDAMMEMKYLDQVITETLRKYPALSSLIRIASEDYEIPGTTIKLQKNTEVLIPVKEIHYDPDIYDEPKEFRPERFNPEEVLKRHTQAFLGFGDGPRNCIGLRFGRMQSRIGLITLLRKFKFTVSAKTPAEIVNSKYSVVLVPGEPIILKADKL